MASKGLIPIHFSQAYGLASNEDNLDFFDVNLAFDSRLFIDPFLIKKSAIEEEQVLFDRFGDFFRYAYDQSLLIDREEGAYENLKTLLNFHEPKELGLGYTEFSNTGAGPGPSFANILFKFFVGNTARRLVKEEGLYPDGKFNPVTLQLFIDDLGLDGLSDITGNIIMDYLISYTQNQCKIHNVPLKTLPLQTDGFDFEEMEWKGGAYYELPENLERPGEAVILVPKRLLRSTEAPADSIESKVKAILEQDPELTRRFSSFLHKKISEISISDIRELFLKDESIFQKYFEALSRNRGNSYDFGKDIYKLLAVKTYSSFFANRELTQSVEDCSGLLSATLEFIDIFKDHCSAADGWKEMWVYNAAGDPERPQHEAVTCRIFRGMGFAYFHHLKGVTFEAEVGTGNGPVDFKVIYLNCRIAIEVKKLENASPKGVPPLPSYLHGIERQLPDYAHLCKASNAIYITGQHYTKRNRPKNNHDERADKIRELLPTVEAEMKKTRSQFQSLHYINIDFSPHPSASKK